MKKFSKVLAMVLLLAMLLSLFGIFSAFAADTTLTPTVVIDMDKASKHTISNNKTSTSSTGPLSLVKATDENGEVYWTFAWDSSISTSTSAGAYIEMSPTSDVVVKSGGTKGAKNTDFMVIDVDVSSVVGREFLDLKFHMRYGNSAGSTSQDTNGYPWIASSTGSLDTIYSHMSAATGSDKYHVAPIVQNDNEWVNFTYVYDFRGEDSSAWQCYAYIDGYYAATFSATKADAYYLKWLRFSPPDQKAVVTDSPAAKIRNLTYTTFPTGWDGELTKSMIGNNVPLWEIDELAYCFEGTNAKRATDNAIATVQRAGAEQAEPIYSFEDLNGNIFAGDTVTILSDIVCPILAACPTTDFTVVNGKDGNGSFKYEFVDTSSITDWSDLAFIVLNTDTRAYVKSGDEAALTAHDFTTNETIYLLKDVNYAPSTKSLGSKRVVLDLNGFTATIANSGRNFDDDLAKGYFLRFQNGTLIYKSSTDLTMFGSGYIVHDNVNLVYEASSGVYIDQRGGSVIFRDTDITHTAKLTLISSKGNEDLTTSLVFDNSTIDSPVSPINVANTNSSGYRYAGLRNWISIINGSNLKAKTNLIEFTAYGSSLTVRINEAGEITATSDNTFDVNLTIKDSTVDAEYRVLSAAAAEVYTKILKASYDVKGNKTTEPDGKVDRYDEVTRSEYYAYNINVTTDFIIENSTIKSNGLFAQENVYSTAATPESFSWVNNVTVGENVVIDNKEGHGLVQNSENDRSEVVINLQVADGTLTTVGHIDRYTDAKANTTLGAGDSELAYTNTNGDYGFIVTPNFDTYTYQLGDDEPVEFYWNKAEGEQFNIDKVVTLAKATDLYRYEWDINGNAYASKLIKNFTFGVNLTLREDININIFLPAGVTPNTIGLEIDGVAAEYTVFEGKNKVVVKGVDPTTADNVYVVTGTVNGAYGESVEINGEISVLDYIAKAYDKDEDLLQAVLNYIVAAAAYAGEEVVMPEGIGATAVPEAVYGDVKAPVAGDVITGVEMVLDGGFKWVISTTADSATATYTIDGVAQENAEVSAKGGKIVLNLKAEDLLGDVVVTAGGETVTFNYAWYVSEQDAGNANLQALLAAIHAYATEAAAYNAN